MAETLNYGFYVLPHSETTVNVLEWVQNISGNTEDSNFVLIDALLKQLENEKMNAVVESATEPTGLIPGDEWDKILE